MGFQLSPKHGLNPSHEICFWCGKRTGRIVSVGLLRGDLRAGPEVVTHYDPCESCSGLFCSGTLLVQVTDRRVVPPIPEIVQGWYPTGPWAVLNRDIARREFGRDQEGLMKIRRNNMVLLTVEAWKRYGLEGIGD